MTRPSSVTLGLIAALSLGATSQVGTAEPRPSMRRPQPPSFERLAKQLDLDAAQVEKMRAIEDARVRQAIEMRGKIEYARHELRRMLRAARPDRDMILSKVDEIARINAALKKLTIMARLDQRELLSAEQRERLEELRAKRLRLRREPAADADDDDGAPAPPPPGAGPGF